MSIRIFFVVFLIIPSITLFCYDDRPKCFKEIETSFFQETDVVQALSLYQSSDKMLSQGQWSFIGKELKKEAQKIPQMMKERAKKMRPDPLQNPFQPLTSIKLLNEITFEIFVRVMTSYDITDPLVISQMYQYIYQSQLPRIQECTLP